jgi:hypothetical protein
VQRRLGVENTNQQGITQFRVELYASINNIFKTDVALYYYKGASLGGRKRRCGKYDFVIYTLTELAEVFSGEGHSESIAEGNQSLTDLALKKHDDGYADVKQCAAENEFNCGEILSGGNPVKEGKCSDRGCHRSGTSSTNKFQNCIHEQEDQKQVRDVSRLTESCEVLRVWQ